MTEFKPSFIQFWIRSAANPWVLLFFAFSAFLIIYNERNLYPFLAILIIVFFHSHIFAKKITITDSQQIKISYLYGPNIFSCQLQDIEKLLFSDSTEVGEQNSALIFTIVKDNEPLVRRIKFDYWTKSQLLDVYNKINSMLPEKDE